MMDAARYSDEVLTVTRTFDAVPERVFAAWTNPQLLKQWWGPPGSVVVAAEVDLRVGGQYRLGIKRGPEEIYFAKGVYQEVQPPHKLVFTWRWENPEMDIGESLVTLEFQAKDDKTDLRLTHERLPTPEARLHHAEGWMGMMEKLQDFL